MDDDVPAARAPLPLQDFYDAQDESVRLSSREGRVEFLRTQQLLRDVLAPPPARILDVGGADGVHARWLRDDGYDVEVVDIVPAHVERARAHGLAARLGDARRLDLAAASAEAVLLLGPLYHLPDADDRAAALSEAGRVLVPGGLLAAAAVSRIAVALDHLRKDRFRDPAHRASAARIAHTGVDRSSELGKVFYFHTSDELAAEVTAAGFVDVAVRGIEGPAWPAIDPLASPEDPLVEQVLEIARLADADRSTVGASAHLLALARRN